MPIVIKCRERGPYLVSGDLRECEIYDAAGERIDLTDRTTVALCRCGHSRQKPLCDGSHHRLPAGDGE